MDFDKETSKIKIQGDGLNLLREFNEFCGVEKDPLVQAKEINVILDHISKFYHDDSMILMKTLKIGHISLETQTVCFEKLAFIDEINVICNSK